MSLPYYLKITPDTVPNKPYLYVDPLRENYWKRHLSSDKSYKIGICWSCEKTHDFIGYTKNDKHAIKMSTPRRSVPLELFESLARVKGVQLYSLQKSYAGSVQDELVDNPYVHCFDNSFDEQSFMDTAAVMKSLNLVVTIDTSIAHLAGGLGVKTCVMLPHIAEWRWMLNRTDTPWYPNTRLFRQPKKDDWATVIEDIITYVHNDKDERKKGSA